MTEKKQDNILVELHWICPKCYTLNITTALKNTKPSDLVFKCRECSFIFKEQEG